MALQVVSGHCYGNSGRTYKNYVIVIPWSPGIYHRKTPDPEGAVLIYPASDWPSPYLRSYIANDLGLNSNLELWRFVLSIS